MPRLLLVLALGLALLPLPGRADTASWEQVLAAARGQTVYFHAWGGSPQINAYIAWAAQRVAQEFDVTLEQVKLADTADAVARVVAEKAAGRTEGGAVDLVWINGENFAAMKRQDLLYGPFADRLPNMALVDETANPTARLDATLPTEGFESPWGMAQFVFVYDRALLPEPPRTIPDLLAWAEAHPGRFTYPQPPDYLGTTFLKQALHDLTPDPAILQAPVTEAGFAAATAPLWAYLDRLHAVAWRGGGTFPPSSPAQRQLLADGELDIALGFDPLEAASAIASGLLPPTARVFGLEGGSIANTNFLAIPFNASAKEGAMVVADFLLSPEAQARKQDPRHWGGWTVLALDRLGPAQRAWFDAIPADPAAPSPEELGPGLPEPHPSWTERLEAEWLRRYRSG